MNSVHELAFEDEDIVVAKSSNAADTKFDLIIGTIEDIVMEPKFQKLQDDFMTRNYKHFEDTDENKLIYTTIHKEYTALVEKYLEQQLKKRIDNFSMSDFMKDLMSRREELDGEIFEILLTFDDFIEFKQLMLGYKSSKEGKSLDLSVGLCIQSINFSGAKSTASAATTTASASSSSSSCGSKKKAATSTPLLDNTQVDHCDSDHDDS